jgi:tetratricopeptide (TPR) repeat protein
MPKTKPKQTASKKETIPNAGKPRRRFSPLARLFIALGALAIGWLLTGIILETVVQSAISSRNLTRAIRWSKVAAIFRPWDSNLKVTPARAARLSGDLDAWSAQMKPLASPAADSSIARELQFGKIQLGDFPDDFHAQMGKMLDVAPGGEVAEAFVVGLLAKRDRENARAILDAWKRDEPQNPQVQYVEAIFAEDLDNRREATAQLAKFIADHPHHQPARLRLASILLADRRYEPALTELSTLVSQGDDSPTTLAKLVRCHRLLGDVEKAKSLLAPIAAASEDAQRDLAQRELAECQLELGEYAEAAKSFRTAGLERLSPSEQTDLALADYLSGKPETAESVYAAIDQARQLQSRRADLEVYLLLNPEDEKTRRELNKLNGNQ